MANTRSTTPAPPPIVAVRALPNIEFIAARWYRAGQRRHRAIWVVLHATHGAEGKGKARAGALELARCPPENKRSAHVFIDTSAVVQCVPFECEAYHAGSNANHYGEGIELCGRADQTREQWLDAASLPMLQLAAHVVRWRCDMLHLPITYRKASDLALGLAGVTTHAEVAKAFPKDTRHWDPGPGFPIAELLDAARALAPTVP